MTAHSGAGSALSILTAPPATAAANIKLVKVLVAMVRAPQRASLEDGVQSTRSSLSTQCESPRLKRATGVPASLVTRIAPSPAHDAEPAVRVPAISSALNK